MGRSTRLSRSASALGREFFDALYPVVCPLCQAPVATRDRAISGAACPAHALPDPDRPSPHPRCDRCGAALPSMLPDGTRCAQCRRNPPRIRRVVTLGDYRRDDGLRQWILALKHGGRRDLAEPLGRALSYRLRGVMAGPVLLVPVPIHPLRRLERGYDQAELLACATAAADSGGGTRYRRLLRRTRMTPPQGALGSTSRRANLANAVVPARTQPVDLLGVSVWIVDDVMTSGATVQACAVALGQLGARRVSVLCAARAGDPRGDQD